MKFKDRLEIIHSINGLLRSLTVVIGLLISRIGGGEGWKNPFF